MENNEIEKKIISLEERIKKIEDRLPFATSAENRTNISQTAKKLSIKEFLMTKNLTDDVVRTLAIAYFLEHFSEMTSFNVDDINNQGFRLAKIKPPLNTNDKININIKKGYIMDATEKKEAKKAWVLTATGESFVENDLNLQK